MKLLRRSAIFTSLLAAAALAYACVGDDPIEGAIAAPDGGPSGDTDSGKPGAKDDAGDDGGNGTPCAGGTMCNGTCVPTSTDGKNCGRCDHDCGGATCSAGVCKEKVVVASGDAGAEITSLTTDQTDDNPKGLAQRVFWSVAGAAGGVYQDNVTGGNTLTLSTTAVVSQTNVVVNGANVWWFAQNFGGAPQPVLKGQVNSAGSQSSLSTMNGPFIQSILFDPTGQNVVGSYKATSTTHGLFKCPAAGGACTSMITYSGAPGGNVATDGTYAYYCDPDNGLIQKTALAGSSSSSYITSQATPNLLRVDGTNIYWSNSGTKTIQRGALGGGTAKQMAATTNAANAVAADAVNVYWTDNVTGTLNYAPVTGAGPNTAYVTLGASSTAMRLVRDTSFLYFTHNGGIYRVALP